MIKIERYVIVDGYTLQYSNDEGYLTDNIFNASRYETYHDACDALNCVDEPNDLKIYKVRFEFEFERCDD